MIDAKTKSWNSPTTLYIARALDGLAKGRRLTVLDAGCGDGIILQQLAGYGYDLYGSELDYREPELRARLGELSNRVRLAEDDCTIPFPDRMFDVVYANQVFEHVAFLDSVLAECARVLRDDGALLINFPLATTPVELHVRIPFAHWLPPGRLRITWLRMFYVLRLGNPLIAGGTAGDRASYADHYLSTCVFYRFINEIRTVSRRYFRSCELDTSNLIEAKLDLMNVRGGLRRAIAGLVRPLVDPLRISPTVTYLYNAAFIIRGPRREAARKRQSWRMERAGNGLDPAKCELTAARE